jgi:hypothetical protein
VRAQAQPATQQRHPPSPEQPGGGGGGGGGGGACEPVHDLPESRPTLISPEEHASQMYSKCIVDPLIRVLRGAGTGPTKGQGCGSFCGDQAAAASERGASDPPVPPRGPRTPHTYPMAITASTLYVSTIHLAANGSS